MIRLNRRRMLMGAVAAGAAPVLGSFTFSSARAATPPAGKQAPGWYRYKVGSIEVTAVTDGARTNPIPEGFIVNATKDQVNEALGGLYLEKDKITTPFTATVINTGPKLVLIDTGLGPAAYEQSKGAVGQLHTNLVAAGIDRNTVDVVIISHFHPDHINGLLTADNKAAFPNAEIMVPAAEWAYWTDEGKMSKLPAGGLLEAQLKNIRRVFGALGNKVTQYEPDKELAPGITSYATYGHTLGHTSHILSSGPAKILVQADVTAGVATLFVRNPGWHNMFDMEGPMAEQTRRKVYDMAATEKLPRSRPITCRSRHWCTSRRAATAIARFPSPGIPRSEHKYALSTSRRKAEVRERSGRPPPFRGRYNCFWISHGDLDDNRAHWRSDHARLCAHHGRV